MASGLITVRPLNAALSNDGEMFGKADPYVVVQIGSQKQQTQVHKDGGKNPRWNDALQFHANNDQVLKFFVMDRDHMSSSDCIAEGQVNLAQVYQMRSMNSSFPVTRNGKPNGTVTLAIDFQPGQGGFGGPQGGFGGQQGGYGGQQGGFGGQQGGFGGQQGGFGGPQGGYGGQQGGYGHGPQQGYGAPQQGFGGRGGHHC